MRPGSQRGYIQCGDSSFSQDILGFFLVFCSCNAYPYFQNFMDHTSRWQTSFIDFGLGQPRTNSSSTQTLRPLCSILSSLSTSMGFLSYTYPSSDDSLSSTGALSLKPNCMIWAHDPTIYISWIKSLNHPKAISNIHNSFYFKLYNFWPKNCQIRKFCIISYKTRTFEIRTTDN